MGLFDSKDDVQPLNILGNDVICPVCGGQYFWRRESLLNTTGMTFLGLDWANINAENYVCNHCGYMFWFHPQR